MGEKFRVARSDSGAKIIFKCADRMFGGVADVGVLGDKMEVNVVFSEVFLHGVGALVVEDTDIGVCTILA